MEAYLNPVYPDLPTVDEAGLKGFEVDLWLGIFAPAGLPADVLARLNADLGERHALVRALGDVKLDLAVDVASATGTVGEADSVGVIVAREPIALVTA